MALRVALIAETGLERKRLKEFVAAHCWEVVEELATPMMAAIIPRKPVGRFDAVVVYRCVEGVDVFQVRYC